MVNVKNNFVKNNFFFSVIVLSTILYAMSVSAFDVSILDHSVSVDLSPEWSQPNAEIDYQFNVTNVGSELVRQIWLYKNPAYTDFVCEPKTGWALTHYENILTPVEGETTEACHYVLLANASGSLGVGMSTQFYFTATSPSEDELDQLDVCELNWFVESVEYDGAISTGDWRLHMATTRIDVDAPEIDATIHNLENATVVEFFVSDESTDFECASGIDYCTYTLYRNDVLQELEEIQGDGALNLMFNVSFQNNANHTLEVECVDVVGHEAIPFSEDFLVIPPTTVKMIGSPNIRVDEAMCVVVNNNNNNNVDDDVDDDEVVDIVNTQGVVNVEGVVNVNNIDFNKFVNVKNLNNFNFAEFSSDERIGVIWNDEDVVSSLQEDPCDGATQSSQCDYVNVSNLPQYAVDALEIKGANLTMCADREVLLLSSGNPLDETNLLSTDMSNDGCGLNPDDQETFDCVDLTYTPDSDKLVVSVSAEYPAFLNSITDWMRIQSGNVSIDVSINDWDEEMVDILSNYGPALETGVIQLATIPENSVTNLRVADSADSIYDTKLIILDSECFEEIDPFIPDPTEPPVVPDTGSLQICKQLYNSSNDLVSGFGLNTTFTVPLSNLSDASFSTALTYEDDMNCVYYNNLTFGEYEFGEEIIVSDFDGDIFWDEPLYNLDYPLGSFELFSDGLIVLSEESPDKVLVVRNKFDVNETIIEPPIEPPVEDTGSLLVCKELYDASNNLVSGFGLNATFTLPFMNLSDATFNTHLTYKGDMNCVYYNNLTLGVYEFGEEIIVSDFDGDIFWDEPLYNLDYPAGSFELFSDGLIVLSEESPDKILVVKNRFDFNETTPVEPPQGPQECFDYYHYVTQNTPITLMCENNNSIYEGFVSFRVFNDGFDVTEDYCLEYDVLFDNGYCHVEESTFNFKFLEDSEHILEFYCTGYTGVSEVNSQLYFVNTGNILTSHDFIGPWYFNQENNATYIDSVTLVNLSAEDLSAHPTGINNTYYRFAQVDDAYCLGEELIATTQNDEDWTLFVEPFPIPNESCHMIQYFSTDNLGVDEEIVTGYFFVDKTPPMINVDFVGPYYESVITTENVSALVKWINPLTNISVNVFDVEPHPSGLDYSQYRYALVDDMYCWTQNMSVEGNSDWTTVDDLANFEFNIGSESCHLIEIRGVDHVNKTRLHKELVFVDDFEPITDKQIGAPNSPMGAGNIELGYNYFNEENGFDPALTEEFCLEDVDNCVEVTLLSRIDLACTGSGPHPIPDDENSVYFKVHWDANDVTENYCEDYQGEYVDDEESPHYGYCYLEDGTDSFYFQEETWHRLEYYCENTMGVVSEPDIEYFKVEGTAFEIELNEKWNLISVPVKLLDDSMDDVFGNQEGVVSVWTYNGTDWSVWSADGPTNLDTMHPGWGYWVLTTEASTLGIGGSLLSPAVTPPSRPIVHGWNLIGYYGFDDAPINDANVPYYAGPNNMNGKPAYCVLATLASSSFDTVFPSLWTYWEQDNPNHWKMFDATSSDDLMNPGAGYWLFYSKDSGIYGPSTTCSNLQELQEI